jgi:hypothetical protein
LSEEQEQLQFIKMKDYWKPVVIFCWKVEKQTFESEDIQLVQNKK